MNTNPFDTDLQALQVHLKTLPRVIERKIMLSSLFRSIHEKMNQGLFYENILDFVFMSLDKIIPYDRIGIALIEEQGKQIRLSWVRSKLKISTLKKDYSASMKNSSLQKLISSGQPRIINNLEAYLIQNPDSLSTKLALQDGIHSSLTCPLIFDGRPLGVIFFSSAKISTYDESHIDLFSEIASGLALIVEQGLHKKTRELLNSKEKFFRNTIHDLNNPLMVIKLTLDMLARKKWFQDLGEESKNAFTILKRNCEAMINLTTDLTYAEQHKVAEKPLNFVKHPLKKLLNEILLDSEVMAKKKDIKVRLISGNDIPAIITMDPGKIKEAVENLVSNAIKYSQEKTRILIKVSKKTLEPILCLAVTDEGQGIPESEIPKLFTEFGTTTVRPTANEPSCGLGLLNVKRIIHAHHGDVFVRSKNGAGSSFGFWIPFDHAATSH